jgi:threonine dehydratase
MSFQPMKNVDTDFDDVLAELKAQEYVSSDLSKNELAKVHARHMAGGRARADNERLFRFEFPESPGALKTFLMAIDVTWNVSLFHYRNHGDDFGRVLVGIQIPKTAEDEEAINEFLQGLGYNWVEETDNEVYKDFLMGEQ